MTFKRLLPLANAGACLLFVLLREPAPPDYLAKVEHAGHGGDISEVSGGVSEVRGGIYEVSGLAGTIACRNLYAWSEWHGGEALGVKILEAINLPAVVFTAVESVLGEVELSKTMSACRWSWVLGAVFLVASTLQWWILGTWLDLGLRRFRNRGKRL
jgi:hypothetical protein